PGHLELPHPGHEAQQRREQHARSRDRGHGTGSPEAADRARAGLGPRLPAEADGDGRHDDDQQDHRQADGGSRHQPREAAALTSEDLHPHIVVDHSRRAPATSGADPRRSWSRRWPMYPRTARASAGPHSQQGKVTANRRRSAVVIISAPTSIGTAAKVNSAATAPPGTTAAAIGTSRPATTGIQRGNLSPHGRISPRVSTTASQLPEERARPHSRVLSSSPSGAISGQGVSQDSRISA